MVKLEPELAFKILASGSIMKITKLNKLLSSQSFIDDLIKKFSPLQLYIYPRMSIELFLEAWSRTDLNFSDFLDLDLGELTKTELLEDLSSNLSLTDIPKGEVDNFVNILISSETYCDLDAVLMDERFRNLLSINHPILVKAIKDVNNLLSFIHWCIKLRVPVQSIVNVMINYLAQEDQREKLERYLASIQPKEKDEDLNEIISIKNNIIEDLLKKQIDLQSQLISSQIELDFLRPNQK